MRLFRSVRETVIRTAFIAILAGGAWLLMQFYTEQEVVVAANRFWAWWSTLFTGDLAQYWNPIGAAVVLGAAVLFVLNPIMRLFRSRRYGGGSHYDNSNDYSFGDDAGDND